MYNQYAEVAQLVEQLPCKEKVGEFESPLRLKKETGVMYRVTSYHETSTHTSFNLFLFRL